MPEPMFEWDERKRLDVLRTREVDLRDLAPAFEGPMITPIDRRGPYGEIRFRAQWLTGGVLHVIVYAVRGAAIRSITAWKAGRSDHERYQALFAGRDRGDAPAR
ncbi:BrnT family toxin [Salinarimonas sp. NSM]